MADNENESKLEFKDPVAADEGPYLTKPRAQVDLEQRLGKDAESVQPVTVNPDPFGDEDYAGTDPVYQNHANRQMKPYASEGGAEKDAEDQVKAQHDLDDVDDSRLAADHGTGGKAVKAGEPGGETFRTILPGQEGYDLKKAEEQNGPPLRVYADERPSEGSEEEVTETDNSGTNFGSTTEQPPTPSSPSSVSGAAGSQTAPVPSPPGS